MVQGIAGSAVAAMLPGASFVRASPVDLGQPRLREHRLTAAPARAALAGAKHPATEVWAYSGQVPGPEIRARQGDRVRIIVENRLPEETTVHWHGVRVPNAMDGVPHLTQKPIAPGDSFTYEFDVLDAGTFWYHPHQRSFEQVDRGLSGALIVEERGPLQVDRDVVWLLDDWRLKDDAQIAGDFGNLRDASHAGRLGNTVTINGRVPETFSLRAGERVRLRLINAANARFFEPHFDGHIPIIVALDGQPVAPHPPDRGRLILGPGQRADLILDAVGRAGERFKVIDRFYQRQQYELIELAYNDAQPLREGSLDAVPALPSNPVAEPDLSAALRHDIEFGGGMMDPKMIRMMREQGRDAMTNHMQSMMRRMQAGMIWTINGVSVTGHVHDPLLTLERGRSYVFEMRNDTAWWHPMHLHGHIFRVLSRDGKPTPRREWLDTVLMAPDERVEIAFVADNPGDWMFHCHIFEHQMAGMMGTVRVSGGS